MPREQKKSTSQNLASYKVLIEDTSYYSEYFRVSNFVSLFTSGRNGFLVGGTGKLKPHSSILIDVIDSDGNSVFYAPVANYVEGGSRLIQVEVYSDTPKGQGYIVLMGEAIQLPNGQPIPGEWVNKYNVRWKIPVHFESKRRNTTPIRFYSQPNLGVVESANQPSRDITRTYQAEYNYNMNLVLRQEAAVDKGYYIELNIPPSGSAVDDNFYFTRVKKGGVFTGSLVRTERRVVEDDIGNPVRTDYTFASSSLNVSITVTDIINNKFGFTTSSLTFSDGTKIKNLQNIVSGSFRDEVSYYTFASGGSTYFSRSVVDYTSSIYFRYPTDSGSIKSQQSSSILTFRLNNLNTSTGEVGRIAISSKPFLDDFSAFETLYEFQPGISNVLIESSSGLGALTSDRQFSIGQFVSSSYPHSYWVSSYITASGFDVQYYNTGSQPHIPLITSSLQPGQQTRGIGALLDGIYAHETSSMFSGAFFIGTRKPYEFFSATEYTLEYNLSYTRRSTFPNSDTWPSEHTYDSKSGRIQTYIAPHTSSTAQSDKDLMAVPRTSAVLGLQIDDVMVSGQDKANFYKRKVNFSVPRDGLGHVRFVIQSGYWEISEVSIYPAEEFGFSFDEVSFTAENTKIVNSTHIFKTDFYDLNNNSVNLSVYSEPLAVVGPVQPTAASSLTWTRTHLTGDGSTLIFTLSGSAITESTFVLINGLEATPTEDYTVSGTTLTFVEAPPSGSEISVRSVEI